MLRLEVHAARLLTVALGIGAFAFGLGAGPAAAASTPPATSTPPAAPTPPAPVDTGPPPPSVVVLTQGRVSYWAYPQVAATVRATPSAQGRKVGKLRFLTPDGLQQAQVYQAQREERGANGRATWIEVSLPRRPNGVTGWVPARALGALHVAYGLIVVDLAKRHVTYYNRQGRAVFNAPVGIGRPSLPTPKGRFYVLYKWSEAPNGFLGPHGFTTSAYAPTLTDWPGGGVVGIHGTSEPQLIPGDPSHGCVRLRNANITRLWHMAGVGTAIEIE